MQIPRGARAKSQMATDECKKTKVIANLRIHVERAISRMNFFWILKRVIPVTMLHHIDDIVVTCAALSNLKPKLIQKKSNWDHSWVFFELSCIPVLVLTKIFQVVAGGISWKSANYRYKPKRYYLLPVFFLSFCLLVTL